MDRQLATWIGAGLISGYAIGYYATRYFSTKGSSPNSFENRTRKSCVSNDIFIKGLYKNVKSQTQNSAIPCTAMENFPDLKDNKSYMARHLTQENYSKMFSRTTPLGFTIDQAIQIGVDNPSKVGCGVLAGDEYCYDVFNMVFDPVINDRHEKFRGTDGSALKHFKNFSNKEFQFDSKYVKSTYFLISRCLHGFRFPASCSRAERNLIELHLKTALLALTGSNSGTYIHLTDMTSKVKASLPDILQTASNIIFDRKLSSRGTFHDWPSGRGVFYSSEYSLLAWINFEDHLRVMFCSEELNFLESYKKFQSAMVELEANLVQKNLKFAYHCHYGYLVSCPSGVGTALRAAVSVDLPKTIRHEKFHDITENLRLHLGAKDPEALKKGWLDVYNADRLGFTEEELIHQVGDAVLKLCEIEAHLEAYSSFSDITSYKSILDE